MNKIEIKDAYESILYEVADCGLPIYIWQNNTKIGYSLSLGVKYGSNNIEYNSNGKEIKDPAGIAHYLEHLKFNESNGTCANDFFENLGLYSNAYTSFNVTNYEVAGTTHFDEALTHLLDFVYQPYFTDDLIEKERGIITEEAKMGLDNPYNKLFFSSLKNTFSNYNYKNDVIGTIDSIKSITKDQILNAYNTFYTPNNMFLFVTGNVDAKKVIKLVNKVMNLKNIHNNKLANFTIKEKSKVLVKRETIYGNIEIPKVQINFKINNNDFIDFNIIEFLSSLKIVVGANFSSTSSFKEDLINSRVVEDFTASVYKYDDYTLIEFTIESLTPDDAVNEIVNKLKNMNIDKSDIERTKKRLKSDYILSFDSMESVDNKLQKYLIVFNKIVDNELEIIDKIDINICKNILDRLNITDEYISITKMLPNE